MGVKLKSIIVAKIINIQDLKGKVIAVDAPNIIMGLLNFALKNKDSSNTGLILDRTQRPISHLYGLLYRVNFFYSKKIFPIFCFDGKISELKKLITKDQLKDFMFTQKWYEEAIKQKNKTLAREIALSNEYLWKNIIKESKQLLGALGVPYIESPASAESQCAFLVKYGFTHYSNSQDFDSLLFGCPNIVQNLSKSLRRKVQGKWQYQKIQPININLQKNLSNLGISLFQLIDIGILIGTDYFSGIFGIGPKKALALIRKYKSLETLIMKEYNNYDFSGLNPSIIKEVRKIFLFPDVHERIDNLLWNPPNKSRIFSLMCKEHFLNKDRVERNLDKFEKNYDLCRDHFIHQRQQPKKIQLTLDNLL
ncbi:MAG: flap structure-specific endonuclease [Candidatus Thorarchaeota archaeon]